MPLQALVTGLMNSAGAAVSAAQNYKYSKKLQEHQYDLNRKALREQFANTRYSLESAGYNPLLAVGSSAQGFSAGASASGGDLSSVGSDAVNSAIQAKQANANIKNLEETNNKLKEETESVKLDNKLKRKELDTSPRGVISDIVRGESNPTVDFIKKVGNKLGINTNSAVKSVSKPNIPVGTVKLHNDKPYVQKGVPRSVIKQFNSANSANKFRIMSDSEAFRYKGSKRQYQRPPRQLPR